MGHFVEVVGVSGVTESSDLLAIYWLAAAGALRKSNSDLLHSYMFSMRHNLFITVH